MTDLQGCLLVRSVDQPARNCVVEFHTTVRVVPDGHRVALHGSDATSRRVNLKSPATLPFHDLVDMASLQDARRAKENQRRRFDMGLVTSMHLDTPASVLIEEFSWPTTRTCSPGEWPSAPQWAPWLSSPASSSWMATRS